MRIKRFFKFCLRFLFCASILVLCVKSVLDNRKQRETVQRNWVQLLNFLHINSPRLTWLGKVYHFNAIVVMNFGLVCLAITTLLRKEDKFGFLLLGVVSQFLFIHNPYFEPKSGIIMMCSAYVGIYSLLMR